MNAPIGEVEAVWPAVSRTGDLVSPVAAALRDWAAAAPVEKASFAPIVPGKLLAALPHAEVLPGLGV